MMKVSNTMLAVVAALQSGGHTRRRTKYIREKALISNLYPLSVSDEQIVASTTMENIIIKRVTADIGEYSDSVDLGESVSIENLELKSLILDIGLQSEDREAEITSSVTFDNLVLKTTLVDGGLYSESEEVTTSVNVESIYLDTVVIATSAEEDQEVTTSVQIINIELESV